MHTKDLTEVQPYNERLGFRSQDHYDARRTICEKQDYLTSKQRSEQSRYKSVLVTASVCIKSCKASSPREIFTLNGDVQILKALK